MPRSERLCDHGGATQPTHQLGEASGGTQASTTSRDATRCPHDAVPSGQTQWSNHTATTKVGARRISFARLPQRRHSAMTAPALDRLTMSRLALIRLLYLQGIEQSGLPVPLAYSSVLTFHDAVELFL